MNPCSSSIRTLISKCMKRHHYRPMFLYGSDIGIIASNVSQIHCSRKMNNFVRIVKVKSPEKRSNPISHTYLKELLQNCKSVREQIETFHSYVRLTDEDILHRKSICQDIEKIFKSHFTSCSGQLTGSSVSGLGLRGCDVDLSFQLPEDELNKLRKPFYSLKNALINSGAFKETEIAVVPGLCPILNFYYQNLSCDISLDNKSALGGTNLMLLCQLLDDRVAPLCRFISYWSKYYSLCSGPSKFKSYAFFLLVVYFLQTRSPPILPSVQHMFDKIDFKSNQDNWSYDVSKYLDRFESSQNVETIDALLKDFFFFYSKFDFSNVICPLTGQIENPRDFISKTNSDEKKFHVAEISIQDPLNLHWNVTSGVTYIHSRDFKKNLLLICKAYKTEELWQPGVENWGLLSLFTFPNVRKSRKK